MVEYIGSNDDASNLGLYAGIGAVTFAGGAALAYRATSPIYKDSGKKPAIVTKASDVADTKKGFLGRLFSNPMEGALNQHRADAVNSINGVMNTKRQLKKDSDGINSAMRQATADAKAAQPASGPSNLRTAVQKAKARKGADMDTINGIRSAYPDMPASELLERMKEVNPNTLLTQEAIQKRINRSNNRPVSRDEMNLTGMDKYAANMSKAEELRDARSRSSLAPSTTVHNTTSPEVFTSNSSSRPTSASNSERSSYMNKIRNERRKAKTGPSAASSLPDGHELSTATPWVRDNIANLEEIAEVGKSPISMPQTQALPYASSTNNRRYNLNRGSKGKLGRVVGALSGISK